MVKEIQEAIDQERKDGVKKLFPLRLDDHILSDEMMEEAREKVKSGEWRENWACHLRQKHIPDFSQWQDHAVCVKEFDKLLRDLKSKPANPD